MSRAFFDRPLQVIDFSVGRHHACAKGDVAADQGIHGLCDLTLGQAAHLGNETGELLEIVVEGLGRVFKSHRSILSRICRVSRNGR